MAFACWRSSWPNAAAPASAAVLRLPRAPRYSPAALSS